MHLTVLAIPLKKINIVTRHILYDTAAQSVHKAREIGLQKCSAFLERIIN